MSNIFEYTPRIARTGEETKLASEPKSIDFDVIEEFDSVVDILDAVAGGLPLHSRKDPETGETPESVCTILFGSTQWENIEELRRSDEWHDACAAYQEANEGVNTAKYTLPKEGRKPNGSNGRGTIKLEPIKLDEGLVMDGTREEAISEKVGKRTKDNYVSVTYKIKVREYTPEERSTRMTNAQLLEHNKNLEAELAALKAEQSDNA